MRPPKFDKEFYIERTIYYKRLRDSTDNPELYVAYEKAMKDNFEHVKFYVSQNSIKKEKP